MLRLNIAPLLILVLVTVLLPRICPAQVLVEPSALTGSWYDPSNNGEGINVDMRSNDEGVVYWYTYDTDGNPVWIVGAARREGNRLLVEQAVTARGARFGPQFDPADVMIQTWGTFSITFDSCESALLEYDGPAEYGQGTQNLVRLTRNQNTPCPPERQFRLGFTPFPSDVTQDAVDFAFSVIANDGDIIAQHFDDGIPWPESYAGGDYQTYDPAYVAEWEGRKAATPVGHQVFVSITPIDIGRQTLAPYRGASGDIPLSEIGDGWSTEGFDSPRVRQAFLQHAINTIEFFEPDYLAIGIEVNLLAANAPDLWSAYVDLHRETYIELKQRYPHLPVFVTVTGIDLLPGWTGTDLDAQRQAFDQVIGFSDLFAISFYPFISSFLTDPLPEETFSDLFALSNKPIAFSETGYPAQHQTIDVAPGFSVTFDGTPAKQRDFFEQLFASLRNREVRFVINFVPRDYDDLCATLGGCSGLQGIWRDTGFYDESSSPRPALEVWRSHVRRPIRN